MAGEESTLRCSKLARSRNSDETQTRWLHVILLIVALSGWLIFILACTGGPVWSPDSSQIMFAFRDVENSRTSVALYDRKTGTVSTILSQPAPKEGELALHPAWQKDGTRALVGIYRTIPNKSDEVACELISIPIKSSLPTQVYNLGTTDGCAYPYPEIDHKVYFGGKDLRWVDLQTGDANAKEFKDIKLADDEGVVFSEGAGQIYYQRKVTRKITADEESGQEIGLVQREDASLKPLFTVWDKESVVLGVGDIYPILWPHGPTLALISAAKETDSDKIVLADESKGIVRTFFVDLGVRPYKLGNLIWSPDGSKLYASMITTGDRKDTLNYGLVEIPLDGKHARLTQIATIQTQLDDDFLGTFRMSMPVSLSPDGHWIAATPAVLGQGQVDDRDRALFLVDLDDSARALQRVAIPRQPASEGVSPTVKR